MKHLDKILLKLMVGLFLGIHLPVFGSTSQISGKLMKTEFSTCLLDKSKCLKVFGEKAFSSSAVSLYVLKNVKFEIKDSKGKIILKGEGSKAVYDFNVNQVTVVTPIGQNSLRETVILIDTLNTREYVVN